MRSVNGDAPKRRSGTRINEDGSLFKKMRVSRGEIIPESDENGREVSPEALLHYLDDVIHSGHEAHDLPEAVALELKGFDANVASVDEYNAKREQIRHLLKDSNFFDRKTELNMGEAAIATAKLEVDRRVTTRRMSKKFQETCGSGDNDILYKGLDYKQRESQASKELRDSRQASIIESCVDFQKQIQWKMNLMEHVKAKSEKTSSKIFPMSDGPSLRTRGGQDRQREQAKQIQKDIIEKMQKQKKNNKKFPDPFKTPQKKVEFNALDERRIIENYALEVASEVRDHCQNNRRQIAPVPFNINILDGEPDSEEEQMEID